MLISLFWTNRGLTKNEKSLVRLLSYVNNSVRNELQSLSRLNGEQQLHEAELLRNSNPGSAEASKDQI
jgi:hypothetical protein